MTLSNRFNTRPLGSDIVDYDAVSTTIEDISRLLEDTTLDATDLQSIAFTLGDIIDIFGGKSAIWPETELQITIEDIENETNDVKIIGLPLKKFLNRDYSIVWGD